MVKLRQLDFDWTVLVAFDWQTSIFNNITIILIGCSSSPRDQVFADLGVSVTSKKKAPLANDLNEGKISDKNVVLLFVD